MAITRTPIIDDSGLGQDGTVIDNAWKQEFYDQIDAMPRVSVSSPPGGANDNLPIGSTGVEILRAYLTGTITGFAQAGGNKPGTIVIVYNVGGAGVPVTLAHASSSSAAQNRLTNFLATSLTLGYQGVATYVYDATNTWWMIGFSQGEFLTVPSSAANYTGNGGTWTVDAGDVTDHKYVLDAEQRTLEVMLTLVTTTLTAGATGITVAGFPVNIPTSPTVVAFSSQASTGWGPIMAAGNGGPGIAMNRTDFAAFPAATNAAYFYLSGRFRI